MLVRVICVVPDPETARQLRIKMTEARLNFGTDYFIVPKLKAARKCVQGSIRQKIVTCVRSQSADRKETCERLVQEASAFIGTLRVAR